MLFSVSTLKGKDRVFGDIKFIFLIFDAYAAINDEENVLMVITE